MSRRTQDGSAGDADYGAIGLGYRRYRQPEPEFEAAIHAAIGSARTVLNVGGGEGSEAYCGRPAMFLDPSDGQTRTSRGRWRSSSARLDEPCRGPSYHH